MNRECQVYDPEKQGICGKPARFTINTSEGLNGVIGCPTVNCPECTVWVCADHYDGHRAALEYMSQ